MLSGIAASLLAFLLAAVSAFFYGKKVQKDHESQKVRKAVDELQERVNETIKAGDIAQRDADDPSKLYDDDGYKRD